MQYNSTSQSIANQWSQASGESKSQNVDQGGGFGRRLMDGDEEQLESLLSHDGYPDLSSVARAIDNNPDSYTGHDHLYVWEAVML